MAYFNDVWKIINSSRLSTGRNRNRTVVRDSSGFRSMPISKMDELIALVSGVEKENARKYYGSITDAETLKQNAEERLVPAVLNCYHSGGTLIQRVSDMMPGMGLPSFSGAYTGWGAEAAGGSGYVGNMMNGAGMPGIDPAHSVRAVPNVWLSPAEASAIYSQKGIPEIIIKKKAQSILLNGVRIKNPRFTPDQLRRIEENAQRLELADHIARAGNWSLVYGGSLMYPMFKKDSPVSMHLPMPALLKAGVLRKGCISRIVTLDRWSTVHIPQWNPTAEDFLSPKKYFIPFLGCDVSGDRCARIVTSAQAGYLGNIMTMGWGISDMNGWYESVLNYMTVMSTIPTMINQMSLLARTVNVDGMMATEGELIMEELARQDTVRVRHASTVDDPINLDVIGNLQAIQRDFKEVPELMRLIRQDFCARAHLPEELILSSERGAFSSGDTTEGALEKQLESVKYIHKDMSSQLRLLTYLVVIDTLGVDRDILAALPYTTIEFDNPALTDAEKKADFFKKMSDGYFNEVSGLMPAHFALKIASEVGETDLPVDNGIIDELKARQDKLDRQADEKHELEMELLKSQVEHLRSQAGQPGGQASPAGKPGEDDRKGHGYSSRLEQAQHNKVASAGKTFERLQRANI